MKPSFCVIQQANSQARHIAVLVMSVQRVYPGAEVFVACQKKCSQLVDTFAFINKDRVHYLEHGPFDNVSAYRAATHDVVSKLISKHGPLLSIDADSVLVNEINIPQSVVDQGFGGIAKDFKTFDKHPYAEYSDDVIYFGNVDAVDTYFRACADSSYARERGWFVRDGQTLSENDWDRHAFGTALARLYLDGTYTALIPGDQLLCTEAFMAFEDKWTFEQLDDKSLARNGTDISIICQRTGFLSNKDLLPLIMKLVNECAIRNHFLAPCFSVKLSTTGLVYTKPAAKAIAHWDRSFSKDGAATLFDEYNDKLVSPVEKTDLYYDINNVVLYDRSDSSLLSPVLNSKRGVAITNYSDSLLRDLKRISPSTFVTFIGYLPQDGRVLTEFIENLDNSAPRKRSCKQPSGEYIECLTQISKHNYMLIGQCTQYVAEALALGVIPILGRGSLSVLHGLTHGVHYVRWNEVDDAETATLASNCRQIYREKFSKEAIQAALIRKVFIGHIEGSDL